MVERFHRHLKAALTARGERERWVGNLPKVLLGIRSTFKDDSNGTPAEFFYGFALRLPGGFLSASTAPRPPVSGYIQNSVTF